MGALKSAGLENFIVGWSDRILLACWQGGLFILAVWLVCRIFRRLPAAVGQWLWWLACLKLLVGLFWTTPLDLPILPASTPQRVEVGSRYELPAPPVEIGMGAIPRSSGTEALPSLFSLRSGLFAIWLVGAAFCLMGMRRQYAIVQRIAGKAQPLDNTTDAAQARELGVLLGLNRSPLAIGNRIPDAYGHSSRRLQ